jgi:hypothetical protein
MSNKSRSLNRLSPTQEYISTAEAMVTSSRSRSEEGKMRPSSPRPFVTCAAAALLNVRRKHGAVHGLPKKCLLENGTIGRLGKPLR